MVVTSVLSGQLASRFGRVRPLLVGALLLLGGTVRDGRVAELESLLPLVAAAVSAEHAAASARGELRAAQAYAREAETLARALDTARAEVERGLRQLAAQTQALQDARARAEEATRAKDEFLAMLGHELRNPLAPIMTALQLMRLKNLTSREHEVVLYHAWGLQSR